MHVKVKIAIVFLCFALCSGAAFFASTAARTPPKDQGTETIPIKNRGAPYLDYRYLRMMRLTRALSGSLVQARSKWPSLERINAAFHTHCVAASEKLAGLDHLNYAIARQLSCS